jgi:hypothetical protein
MPSGSVLFGDDFAYVWLVAAVASARHPGPTLAPEFFIPRTVGMQTHPIPKQMGQFSSIPTERAASALMTADYTARSPSL